jgi:hypothetical protein
VVSMASRTQFSALGEQHPCSSCLGLRLEAQPPSPSWVHCQGLRPQQGHYHLSRMTTAVHRCTINLAMCATSCFSASRPVPHRCMCGAYRPICKATRQDYMSTLVAIMNALFRMSCNLCFSASRPVPHGGQHQAEVHPGSTDPAVHDVPHLLVGALLHQLVVSAPGCHHWDATSHPDALQAAGKCWGIWARGHRSKHRASATAAAAAAAGWSGGYNSDTCTGESSYALPASSTHGAQGSLGFTGLGTTSRCARAVDVQPGLHDS